MEKDFKAIFEDVLEDDLTVDNPTIVTETLDEQNFLRERLDAVVQRLRDKVEGERNQVKPHD